MNAKHIHDINHEKNGFRLPRMILTSSPLGILRLEMMMILSSLSNVTTSATQLGAQE